LTSLLINLMTHCIDDLATFFMDDTGPPVLLPHFFASLFETHLFNLPVLSSPTAILPSGRITTAQFILFLYHLSTMKN
jgi:hypothetical protein